MEGAIGSHTAAVFVFRVLLDFLDIELASFFQT